jgi:predicted nuclease of predicted toxin-antitoxin system
MKFLVDAHLPRKLAYLLREAGHDELHTLDLPLQNRTSDVIINELSLAEQRIVVRKDADFVTSHLIKREPYKLLLISTGNINNNDLLRLFVQNLTLIVDALTAHEYIELDRDYLTVHR